MSLMGVFINRNVSIQSVTGAAGLSMQNAGARLLLASKTPRRDGFKT